MGAVLIRPAATDDLERIAAIYAPYVTDTVITFEIEVPSAQEWRQRFAAITESGLPFLVATLDDQVVGFAYAGPYRSRPAYRQTAEDSIYLAPESRGLGIGGRLLDELIVRTRAVGIRELVAVIADADNPASPALHARRGFVEVGRLTGVGHKHDRWVDTLLMQLSLGVR
ncbi:GNAT family N-acetyltransferase [Microlunatus soli]|uniref:Phosphinothricin acetyltransferase n=1 Tax=Microlunatus soli TaxID=630515 RepID=A0A1H1ZEE2_9ACTN|nr:GNAT family N-acetyltransferase [Microlunatus soli]SDT32161.1 phosphinothricin acetyltransferase [Microlunatus soli]